MFQRIPPYDLFDTQKNLIPRNLNSEIPLQVRERQTDFTGRMREIKIILQRLHGIITYRL